MIPDAAAKACAEAPGRGLRGEDEGDGAEDQMHQRPGDRGDEPGAAARHEHVGDVDVERRHEAVQEREPELAHPAPVVDAREAVHELVQRHGHEEEQLHREDAAQRMAPEALDA